jgi:multidrug resistance efflux pump
MLVVSLVVAFVGAILLRVHTYSSGAGVVYFVGTPVSAQANGNVDEILVDSGDYVRAGEPIIRLSAPQQKADFAQAKGEYDNAKAAYLQDSTDEQAKKSVKTAGIALNHAQAQLDQRIIRAPADGKISDISVANGQTVQTGQLLAMIFEPGAKPQIWAYLHAEDLPRINLNMPLEVSIEGFKKKRAKLKLIDISKEAVGAAEIKNHVGQALADTLKLPNDGQTYILVKAELESDTIRIGSKTFELHHGMAVKAEIAIETKPFLADVFPFFEKYFD